MDMLPLQQYMTELDEVWKLHKSKPKSSEADIEWGQWCAPYNKNIRAIIKDLTAEKPLPRDHKLTEYAVESLQGLFNMWQIQFKINELKVGRVVGRGKLKKFNKELRVKKKTVTLVINKYYATFHRLQHEG
jgi:hypothetical protein